MSVLETIRKRAKLLVVLIGASLVIFVLEDALTSGRFFMGGSDTIVAVANGKKVKYQDFRTAADAAQAKKKLSLGVESLNDSIVSATESSALEDLVNNYVLDPECKKLGISVSDSELHDLMLGPNPANQVYEFFMDRRGHIAREYADPRTGGLNMNAVIGFLQKADDQQQMRWSVLEEEIKSSDLKYKYFSLLFQGLFVTDAMAKQAADDENKNYDISYVLKRYTDMPDNMVTVSDDDIKDYYNKHLYEYNQQDETRRLDYVTFYCNPTSKDLDSIRKQVDTLYAQLSNPNAKIADDSAAIANSDAGTFDNSYRKESELSPIIDSVMTNSKVGTVYGPYKEDNKEKIAKLLDIATLPDSVKYSQIFIPAPNGDFDKAKFVADSVKGVATVENFADLAKTISKDPESADKGGDMGWVARGTAFPPDLEHNAFFGDVGNLIVFKIQQGYLLLCITDMSEKFKCYKVGIAYKNILPGVATRDSVYAEASEFAGKNKASADFEKVAGQMNRRVIDVGENDRDIGLENSRDVVRFAFDKKEGDVSDAINEGETEYLVVHIMQVTEKGTIPLAQVKDEVKLKVLNERKAQKIMADLQGGSDLNALAQKTGTTVSTATGLTFESYSIPKLGREDKVLGTMSALNTGATSKPIEGELGVYVIHIDSTYYPEKPDLRMVQQKLTQSMRYKAQSDAYEALLRKAGYENHLGKYR